jgi:hypothetical protein
LFMALSGHFCRGTMLSQVRYGPSQVWQVITEPSTLARRPTSMDVQLSHSDGQDFGDGLAGAPAKDAAKDKRNKAAAKAGAVLRRRVESMIKAP